MEKHFSKWVWLSFPLFMVLHKIVILFIFGKWITRKEKCQKYFERHRICVFPFFIYNIPKRHTDHEFFFPQTTVFLIAFQFFKCIYISNEMLSQNHQSLMWSVANHWDDMEKCELSTFFFAHSMRLLYPVPLLYSYKMEHDGESVSVGFLYVCQQKVA